MFIEYVTFEERANRIREQMAEACRAAGRAVGSVTLLPVTKNHPPAAAEYAARYGFAAIGENRVQEAVEKRAQVTARLRWELIGHLQSNKSRLAAANFERVQSVDSEKLARQLDQAAGALGKRLSILLQVNAGADPAKFGVEPDEAPRLLEAVLGLAHLEVDGLMTIAPLSDVPTVAHRTFANLRSIRDSLAARSGRTLTELSMGMSGDFAAAIAEGSTVIRVGTALFGPRA
ncbi:MAG TPA: YggS family pyridoxal phosphate-dependent enzyme [Candidatus Didemnitutus sp.]|nr:YggS family pyridoxal phosphate-dependent enzyme [Candidatus Didemnitutus sp.]